MGDENDKAHICIFNMFVREVIKHFLRSFIGSPTTESMLQMSHFTPNKRYFMVILSLLSQQAKEGRGDASPVNLLYAVALLKYLRE